MYVEDLLPVERDSEVAASTRRSCRADAAWRAGAPSSARRRRPAGASDVVEELVVGRPPERVVDDDRAVERRRFFRIGAVEGDVLADAVEDQVVALRASRGRRRRPGPAPPWLLAVALIRSTSAFGKVRSCPKRMPIVFIAASSVVGTSKPRTRLVRWAMTLRQRTTGRPQAGPGRTAAPGYRGFDDRDDRHDPTYPEPIRGGAAHAAVPRRRPAADVVGRRRRAGHAGPRRATSP